MAESTTRISRPAPPCGIRAHRPNPRTATRAGTRPAASQRHTAWDMIIFVEPGYRSTHTCCPDRRYPVPPPCARSSDFSSPLLHLPCTARARRHLRRAPPRRPVRPRSGTPSARAAAVQLVFPVAHDPQFIQSTARAQVFVVKHVAQWLHMRQIEIQRGFRLRRFIRIRRRCCGGGVAVGCGSLSFAWKLDVAAS